MPRQPRTSSGTGIYHVMMRGINHQNRRTQQAQSQTCLGYALQGGGRRSQLQSKRASLCQLERLTGTFRLRYEQRMLACYAMP